LLINVLTETSYNSDYLPPLKRLHCLTATSDNRKRCAKVFELENCMAAKDIVEAFEKEYEMPFPAIEIGRVILPTGGVRPRK
jgi:hypothetical protein